MEHGSQVAAEATLRRRVGIFAVQGKLAMSEKLDCRPLLAAFHDVFDGTRDAHALVGGTALQRVLIEAGVLDVLIGLLLMDSPVSLFNTWHELRITTDSVVTDWSTRSILGRNIQTIIPIPT